MMLIRKQMSASLLLVLMVVLAALFLTSSCSHGPTVNTNVTNVPDRTGVVIIGAGLSGLATAHELKTRGIPYKILELTPKLGGRVRTVQYRVDGEDLSADSGMEEYWESNPAVKMLEKLNLPMRHDVAVSSIVLNGKLHALGDEEPADYYRKIFNAAELTLLKRFKDDLAPLVQKLHARQPLTPLSEDLLALKEVPFSIWTTKRLQSLFKVIAKENRLFAHHRNAFEKVSEWIRVSIECEIGTEWSQISALDGIAEFHIFIGPKGTGEESYRVIGGNDQFTDALAKDIGPQNIFLNKRVNRIVRQGNESLVSYMDTTTNKHGVIRASAVVSTIPIFRLFEVQTEPPLSPKKWNAIQSQKWGNYFKAHVFVPTSASHYWKTADVSSLPILSDSALGVIYDGNPDHKGKIKILSLLITGSQAEAFNFMPLDQVKKIITGQFEQLWPGFSKEIKNIEFYRYHPRAIAAWPVGRSRFDALSDEIRRPENGLYLAGDFTESSHSDGAFLSAKRVAEQIFEAQKQ